MGSSPQDQDLKENREERSAVLQSIAGLCDCFLSHVWMRMQRSKSMFLLFISVRSELRRKCLLTEAAVWKSGVLKKWANEKCRRNSGVNSSPATVMWFCFRTRKAVKTCTSFTFGKDETVLRWVKHDICGWTSVFLKMRTGSDLLLSLVVYRMKKPVLHSWLLIWTPQWAVLLCKCALCKIRSPVTSSVCSKDKWLFTRFVFNLFGISFVSWLLCVFVGLKLVCD